MTDHADTIRRYLRESMPMQTERGVFPAADAYAALDALLAERQQAQHRIRELEDRCDKYARAAQERAAERQQAIDALRYIAGLGHPCPRMASVGLAIAALMKIGEQP